MANINQLPVSYIINLNSFYLTVLRLPSIVTLLHRAPRSLNLLPLILGFRTHWKQAGAHKPMRKGNSNWETLRGRVSDRSNGLPNLKFVQCTVFKIIGEYTFVQEGLMIKHTSLLS